MNRIDQEINQPIFIVGSGRSGTTLLLDLLTKHPDLGWFSNWSDQHPSLHWISVLSRIWDIPFLGSKIAGRIPGLLHSDETINIYRYCGIHELHWHKQAALDEDDLTPQVVDKFRVLVRNNLIFSGKSRFINKNTNNSMRIRYLNAIFPNAIFLHIKRDGRAVANSLIHVDWWPELNLWWAGFTPNDWKGRGNSPIELCGLHWKRQVQEVLSAVPFLNSDQYLEISYEDLTADLMTHLSKILEFCHLSWNSAFENRIKNIKVTNQNFKWREQLSEKDQIVLETTVDDTLRLLGYS